MTRESLNACSFPNIKLCILLPNRFNGRLAAEMPSHPTLFRFIACLRSTVVSDGIAITAAADGGNLKARKVDKARQILLDSAKKVEDEYMQGKLSPDDVLLAAAAHYNDEKVTAFLANVADSLEAAVIPAVDPDDEGDDLLPDVDPSTLDERQAVLNDDPDLEDVETDHMWVTSVWPFAASDTEIAANIIGRAEDIERVVAVVCPLCYEQEERLVAFENCEHLCCRNCYNRCKKERNAKCPMGCGALLGRGAGKVVNVGTLKFARQKEVNVNFGLSQADVQAAAAANGRRPADISEAEQRRIRDLEAIQQAQQDLESSDEPQQGTSRLSRTRAMRITRSSRDLEANQQAQQDLDSSDEPQPGTSRLTRTRAMRITRNTRLTEQELIDLVNGPNSDEDFV